MSDDERDEAICDEVTLEDKELNELEMSDDSEANEVNVDSGNMVTVDRDDKE